MDYREGRHTKYKCDGGELTQEMIEVYLAHHFEQRDDDGLKWNTNRLQPVKGLSVPLQSTDFSRRWLNQQATRQEGVCLSVSRGENAVGRLDYQEKGTYLGHSGI